MRLNVFHINQLIDLEGPISMFGVQKKSLIGGLATVQCQIYLIMIKSFRNMHWISTLYCWIMIIVCAWASYSESAHPYFFVHLCYSLVKGLRILYLSGIPSLRAGTQPPSCLNLDNRLYIRYTYWMKSH